MCKETYHLLQRLDFNNIETQLALQCAPLFAGLKISNLLIVSSDCYQYVDEILADTGISYFLLMESDHKTTLLLYKEKELKEYLRDRKVNHFFKELNYKEFDLSKLLVHFQKRYERYKTLGEEFPHEMGLLLGYPIEDVNGFIEHEGKNFLHSGYWKVYENLPEKLHLFQRYERAKKNAIQLIYNGLGIRDIIENVNEIQQGRISA